MDVLKQMFEESMTQPEKPPESPTPSTPGLVGGSGPMLSHSDYFLRSPDPQAPSATLPKMKASASSLQVPNNFKNEAPSTSNTQIISTESDAVRIAIPPSTTQIDSDASSSTPGMILPILQSGLEMIGIGRNVVMPERRESLKSPAPLDAQNIAPGQIMSSLPEETQPPSQPPGITNSSDKQIPTSGAFMAPKYDDLGRVHNIHHSGSNPQVAGIHPMSLLRVYWEIFMLGRAVSDFPVYAFVVLPLPVFASFESTMSPKNVKIIGGLISGIYAVDMTIEILTLRFLPGSNKLRTLPQSQLAYLISMLFLIDLASTIPWEFIAQRYSLAYAELFVVLRNLRFIRIVQILRRNPIVGNTLIKSYAFLRIPRQFANLFTFFLLLLVIFHLEGCMIFAMGKLNKYVGGYWEVDGEILTQSPFQQYTFAYIRAMGNMFTIGHEPEYHAEKLFTILFVYGAGLAWAALVGIISSISFGVNASSRLFRQKMDQVNEFLEFKKVDDETKLRVREYMEFKYRGKYFEETSILEEFNKNLRNSIVFKQGADFVNKVPFLTRYTGDGRDKIWIRRLVNLLKASYHLKDDFIFEQGDEAEEMYFIFQGWVEIIVGDKVVGKLQTGAFFGEVALLSNTARTASVRAGANCILYTLTRKDLDDALDDFPDMADKFATVVAERLKKVVEEKRGKDLSLNKAPSIQAQG
ncbi:hypothetical protein HK102_012275 [Quaeritorhiza haematococci]|nr:hypothetical protein HK102_012275 [Quaeritorhiza haematococci]